MEGYPKAAAKFCKEANLQPQQPDASIQARQSIMHSIHSGDIESAISALNELDPEVGTCTCTPFPRFSYFAMIRKRVSSCTTHRLRPVMRNNHTLMSTSHHTLFLASSLS
jgi:hypothetical protein